MTDPNFIQEKMIEGIVDKLDEVLDNQRDMSARLENLEKQGQKREEAISEITRTLRGFNGTPGLVTEIALIKEEVKGCPMTKSNRLFASVLPTNPSQDPAKQGDKEDDDKSHENYLNRSVVKFLGPIVSAFIIWFLLTVLPQVLQHFGG